MEYSFMWITFLVSLFFLFNKSTSSGNDLSRIEIRNVTVETNLPDKNDLSNYTPTATLRWEIFPPDAEFDGILINFDKTENDNENVPEKPPACNDLTENQTKIWMVDEAGKPVTCKLPCESYRPRFNNNSGVCTFIRGGYSSVSKTSRFFVQSVEFAQWYKFDIVIYRNWITQRLVSKKIMKFCRNELLQIPDSMVDSFCEKNQNLSRNNPSGPPANMTKKITLDLEKNRASVLYRFRRPLDIFEGSFDGFMINANGKISNDKKIIRLKEDVEYVYEVKIMEIKFEDEVNVTITPTVIKPSDCHTCAHVGFKYTDSFVVPDINACEDVLYCDANATCLDLPLFNNTPAICECKPRFKGNGINDSGAGCVPMDPCKDDSGNRICDDNTICNDTAPQDSEERCVCRWNYTGDGLLNGSGCTNIFHLVAFVLGIPAFMLVVVAAFIAVFKFNKKKKRAIERTFAKFKVTEDDTTISTIFDPPLGTFGEAWEIDRKKIILEGVIGRGNFGVVYKGYIKLTDKDRIVAVKMLSEHQSDATKTEFLAEISLLSTLGFHENLLCMIGCCTNGNLPIYLVTEFMKYGDLLHFLWDSRVDDLRVANQIYDLTEKNMYQIGRQVASGMKYLEEMKIIHGDLAARNVLVGEGLACKISDFGLANDVYRYGAIKGATEKKLPFKWVSPERMLNGKVPITWRSDVWSFGILLYECVTLGASPYPKVPKGKIFENLNAGYRMERPGSCSQEMYGIMLKCWEWTPSKRPAFEDLVQTMEAHENRSGQFNSSSIIASLDRSIYITESGSSRRNGSIASATMSHIEESIATSNSSGTISFCEV